MNVSHRSDQSGSALILALVFLSGFGLFVSGTFYFMEATWVSTRGAGESAEQLYASDSAVESAIHTMRERPDSGSEGGECPSFTYPGEPAITVECGLLPSGDTAEFGHGPSIVAYGSDQMEGVRVSGDGTLRVGGDVHSNSEVAVANADQLQVFGDVSAASGCPGPVDETGAPEGIDIQPPGETVDCEADPVALPLVQRPLLQAVAPPHQGIPACSEAPDVVVPPGTYDNDDLVALNALTSGEGACAGKVVHFDPGGAPGTYYFDFSCDDLPGCTWEVKSGAVVVGGKRDPIAPDPRCLPDGTGVQFVFGGDSRLSVVGGSVDLCGEGDEPVIYGLSARPPLPYASTNARSVPSGTEGFFSSPMDAEVIGGESSAASLTVAESATIEVDFPTIPIPAEAQIDLAALRVAHRETGDLADLQLSAVITAGTQVVDVPAGAFSKDSRFHEDQIDLLSLPMFNVKEALINGMTIAFTASRPDGTTAVEYLDGIELAVSANVPTAPPPPPVQVAPIQPTISPAAPGDEDFLAPDAALLVDAVTADASPSAPSFRSSMRLNLPAPSLPRGARLETAEIVVTHGQTATPGGLGLAATVITRGAAPQTGTVSADRFSQDEALHSERFDLEDVGISPEKLRAGATVDIVATRLGDDIVTERLDGVVLDFTYSTATATDAGLVPTTANSEDPDTSTETSFSPEDSARVIDSVPAQASLTGTETTASITLGFPAVPPETVPASATIESASLRVAHKETGAISGLTLTGLVRTLAPTATFTVPFGSFTSGVELHEDRIDLVGLGMHPDDVRNGMTVTFTATRAGAEVTEFLDGIELALTYTEEPEQAPPAYRGPSPTGCLTLLPYDPNDVTKCALLETGPATRIVLDGPVHAPAGAVDLDFAGDDSISVNAGISARTLWLSVASPPPGPLPAVAPCHIRTESGAATRSVVFNTTGDAVPVMAEVTFTDTQASPCSEVETAVQINDWTVGRT